MGLEVLYWNCIALKQARFDELDETFKKKEHKLNMFLSNTSKNKDRN